MTIEVGSGATTVEQDVPRGIFKRRRMGSSPPVVIEVRIDVNHAEEPAKEPSAAAPKVAEAIEAVAVGKADAVASGWPAFIGKVGDAVGNRIEEIIGTAGGLVEQRIDELITSANSQIDKLVEDMVTQAMDTVIHNVIEQRLSEMLGGITIDLTKLESETVSIADAAADTTNKITG